MKVSFDFDQTLDIKSVQEYAMELVNRGIDVYIHTARFSDKNAPSKDWNHDLYKVCESVGIKKENIVFCNMTDKWEFIINKNFVWHLDDDWIELDLINNKTSTKGISVFGTTSWRNKCDKLL